MPPKYLDNIIYWLFSGGEHTCYWSLCEKSTKYSPIMFLDAKLRRNILPPSTKSPPPLVKTANVDAGVHLPFLHGPMGHDGKRLVPKPNIDWGGEKFQCIRSALIIQIGNAPATSADGANSRRLCYKTGLWLLQRILGISPEQLVSNCMSQQSVQFPNGFKTFLVASPRLISDEGTRQRGCHSVS